VILNESKGGRGIEAESRADSIAGERASFCNETWYAESEKAPACGPVDTGFVFFAQFKIRMLTEITKNRDSDFIGMKNLRRELNGIYEGKYLF